jgi:hypothetical protein
LKALLLVKREHGCGESLSLDLGCRTAGDHYHGPGEAHANLHRERSAAAKIHTVTAPIDPIINPLELISWEVEDIEAAKVAARRDPQKNPARILLTMLVEIHFFFDSDL